MDYRGLAGEFVVEKRRFCLCYKEGESAVAELKQEVALFSPFTAPRNR